MRRHLTSARSDIIVNYGIDVWEIAYVWAWSVDDVSDIGQLEADIYHYFNSRMPLMNHQQPASSPTPEFAPDPPLVVQVMKDEEMATRKQPGQRLLRQVQHITKLIDHMIHVKISTGLKVSLNHHLDRLVRLHDQL